MQIRAGSLLIAHPVYAHREQRKHVVYVTESTQVSTMGLVLNNVSNYDLKEVFHSKGIEWYGPREVITAANTITVLLLCFTQTNGIHLILHK